MKSNTHVFMGTASEMQQKGIQLLRTVPVRRYANWITFFDIDDTLLDTRGMSPNRQTYLPPIDPIVKLCRAVKRVGSRVVIVTARGESEENRRFTENELRYHGIPFDTLFMCPEEWYGRFDDFKTHCRKTALSHWNGEPLFSIGDRTWDFGMFGGIGLWIQDT